MMVIVKAREIVRGMVPTGRFRLTVETDEDGTPPRPLCKCPGGHRTTQGARCCPEAIREAKEWLSREEFTHGIPEEIHRETMTPGWLA